MSSYYRCSTVYFEVKGVVTKPLQAWGGGIRWVGKQHNEVPVLVRMVDGLPIPILKIRSAVRQRRCTPGIVFEEGNFVGVTGPPLTPRS